MNLTEAFLDIHKAFGVGTIRTWANGKKYQKQANGKWVEFVEGVGEKKEEVIGETEKKSSTTDLKGNPKEDYMYAVGDFSAYKPVEGSKPVKLDIGEFTIHKTEGGYFSVSDPTYGLRLSLAKTKKGAIDEANQKLANTNMTDMGKVKEMAENRIRSMQESEIRKANNYDDFTKDVKAGKISYEEAVSILKSAGLEPSEELKNIGNEQTGKTTDVAFADNVYKLPSDRFPKQPTKKGGVRMIFDNSVGKDVFLHDVIREIKEGQLVANMSGRTSVETPSESNSVDSELDNRQKTEKNKKSKPKYYDVNIKLLGNISRKEAIKNMLLAGVPEGIEGDVRVSVNKKGNILVEVMDSGIEMERLISKDRIDNIVFSIKDKKKYNGTDILYEQVQNAKKEGYKNIHTIAGGNYNSDMNGYYTWLRLGYVPNPSKNSDFVKKANKELGTNIKSVTELMYSQEGRDYWKKNGQEFEGTFDLSDNSYSMKTLNDYVNERKKQKGNS